MGGPWLDLVVPGCVVFEAIAAFDRDHAGFHVQFHVAEAPTTVLISVGDQSLKMFLQVREFGFLNFDVFVNVVFSGVALDLFACAFIARAVEVDGYKGDSDFG